MKRHSYAQQKVWRRKNPEKHKAQMARYRNRKRLVEPVPYPATTHCEACGNLLEKPYLDHCHLTGMFRGWLCHQCNTALGLLGDSPDGVRKLLMYVDSAYSSVQKRLLEKSP